MSPLNSIIIEDRHTPRKRKTDEPTAAQSLELEIDRDNYLKPGPVRVLVQGGVPNTEHEDAMAVLAHAMRLAENLQPAVPKARYTTVGSPRETA